ELAALYTAFSQNQPNPLPPLPIQYADFAYWQRKYLQGEILEKQLHYWRQQLTGAPTRLELPTDRPRPANQSYRGNTLTFPPDQSLMQALHRLSKQEGATLFMTLLAAFNVLLSRYSHQQDIIVGSAIANRHHPGLEPLIGCFANTLALRTRV